jgi:hypothetical protein
MRSVSETLERIAANRPVHARFANTLSLLEYIGARKILKSQREGSVTAELLAHVSEEVRHAQALKRVALKLSDGALEGYGDDELLAGDEARAYIQAVDHTPLLEGEGSRDSWESYLYTTLLVEERANRIYPLYGPILSRAGFPGVMKGILKEEEAHLGDIRANLGSRLEALEPLRLREEAAFNAWWTQVEALTATEPAEGLLDLVADQRIGKGADALPVLATIDRPERELPSATP